jgi:hypothetical protein
MAGSRWFAGASDLGWYECWVASQPSNCLWIRIRVAVLSCDHVDRMWWREQRRRRRPGHLQSYGHWEVHFGCDHVESQHEPYVGGAVVGS